MEKSLKHQLKLSSLVSTRIDSYASFHVFVSEDDFPKKNNTGVGLAAA
jgi:hypothetical protein